MYCLVGIKLKWRDPDKTVAFSCALLTGYQRSFSAGPQCPVLYEQKHVRIHEVQTGDDISQLLAEFAWSHASAVIFINDDRRFPGGDVVATLPILVVSRRDGMDILKCLESGPLCIRLKSDTYGDQIIKKGKYVHT